MRKFDALETQKLDSQHSFRYRPELPELLHIEDPALLVMRDFEKTLPLVTAPAETIEHALTEMKALDSHIMLVVENDSIIGIISSSDILGPKTTRVIEERRVKHSDITVRNIMTPRDKITAIDFKILRGAKIGHLIATLKEVKQLYALVIQQEENGQQLVKGLIYVHDIIRSLDRAFSVHLSEARSILELQRPD